MRDGLPGRPDRLVRGADGVELAVHRLGGEGPPVLLAHATGFHGRCWAPLARWLTPQFTVWALDQRGHGASDRSPDGRYDDWDAFAADLLAVVDAVGGGGWRAAGHSLGGGVSLLAEARRPGTFAAIACYEPVVIPPGFLARPAEGPGTAGRDPGGPGPVPLAQLARKRRATFPSRQAALDRFGIKAPFDRWDRRALEAYVTFGLADRPDGTVGLACEREDEARVFEGAAGSPTWGALADVRAPVAVLSGALDADPLAQVAVEVARRLPRGGLRRFDHLDHFGPMVAPDEVGRVMAAALAVAAPTGPVRSTMGVAPPG